jgi:glutamate synthase domain-containing protein 2/glutamate synthase domain-containing protein 1/glutamate synthase domain-containing protein 3
LPPLYDPRFEHDACGVGFVASLAGRASHTVLEHALTSVVNLGHRGAIDADGVSGDGAGVLTQIPRALFERELARLGRPRVEPSQLAVGMVFLPRDAAGQARGRQLVAEAIARRGLELVGWREVPVDASVLGDKARNTQPRIEQALITHAGALLPDDYERELYAARKDVEARASAEGLDSLYIPSLSHRTVGYKGLFVAPQLAGFYPDLRDPAFTTALAVFHQRYSTNTLPNWLLAQPFRMLAHNGEINTLQGNRNWMRAREANLASPLWNGSRELLKPVIWEDGSDSASLDNALELIERSGRDVLHAMMMLVPEAWENMPDMDPTLRAFYEYHACLMEPWDGPAALAFTDGVTVAATLDRNGLRPARYVVTADDLCIMASEVGVVDLPPEAIVEKGRLGPGQMIAVDTERGVLLRNDEIKQRVAGQQPYRAWLRAKLHRLEAPPPPHAELYANGFHHRIGANGVNGMHGANGTNGANGHDEEKQLDAAADLRQQQRAFGYTSEDVNVVIHPMGMEGHDAVFSMGDDTPLPVLSSQPRSFYNYFRQRFAQVTNPPIDPLREQLVMSLSTYVGERPSVLEESEAHARLIHVATPLLLAHDLERLQAQSHDPAFRSATLHALFPAAEGPDGLASALDALCAQAVQAVDEGAHVLILSDRGVDREHAPIPMVLAVGAVHHYLIREGKRLQADLIADTGEAWDIHHFAVLLGYGASAVHPYVALATATTLRPPRNKEDLAVEEKLLKYRGAVEAGLLKICSKMGISTLSSYRGGQIFEIVGMSQALVDRAFCGTACRIGGVGLRELGEEVLRRHEDAFTSEAPRLPHRGLVGYRGDGELHGFAPPAVQAIHKAVQSGSYDHYQEYLSIARNRAPMALRDLLDFRPAGPPAPLDEVESVEAIHRRFVSTAMSLGALSPEAVQTLAIALNRLGGRSNSGEGGEDPDWYGDDSWGVKAHNKIKQVASGRFGVTALYLANAEQLEIKMAQGSKPGEGGQLPGHKVTETIARLRHAVLGVALISPPPHHDIYSIEDLAQLIYDLKQANPRAQIGVKLVSEAGVGTIAAGVAKAYADYILISGHEGGTGASPLSSIKNAGSPWELGLAETQQVLVLNDLRGRVRLRTDGGLKTGREIVIAALLGAEEYGFGTSAVVSIGCDMARQCHMNTCPTGIATQRPDLRNREFGEPGTDVRRAIMEAKIQQAIHYFTYLAMEVREILAALGLRSLEEAVGRVDLLTQAAAAPGSRPGLVDLGQILAHPDPSGTRPLKHQQERNDRPGDEPLDDRMIQDAAAALEQREAVALSYPIRNDCRTVGARLSGEIARRYGAEGLPAGTIAVEFKGTAGQSFGAFSTRGLKLTLVGEANDYVGKGLCGAEIAVMPPVESPFAPHENVVVGNTVLYGATSGRLYAAGRAGERFAVRNSGAEAVVEGAGDHCCEYMTGGVVAVLGATGRNFAAGMSAGVAYVLDEVGDFPRKVNTELVHLDRLDNAADVERLQALLRHHVAATGSARARDILDHWDAYAPKFWVVLPYPPVVQAHTPANQGADTGTVAPNTDAPARVHKG